MLRNMPLYIPADCKPLIFALFKKVHEETQAKAGTLKKATTHLKNIAAEIGLRDAFDLEAEWNRIITEVENTEPVEVFDFWEAIVRRGVGPIKLTMPPDGDTENRKTLIKTLYTSLIKSLFIQFTQEPDIYKCVERLYKALPQQSAKTISWNEIDVVPFNYRMKDRWSAYYKLIVSASGNTYLSKATLFVGLQLQERDFIKAFFNPNPVGASKSSPQGCPREIWTAIGQQLKDKDLHTFRQVSRITFNAVENSSQLIPHRQYIISANKLLRGFIGHPIKINSDCLFSEIDDYAVKSLRITLLKSPHQTHVFHGYEETFGHLMVSYVSKDRSNQIVFLAAYCHLPSHFTVFQKRISDQADENTLNRYISVIHERKPGRWERMISFNVAENTVLTNIKLVEYKEETGPSGNRFFTKTGVSESHVAEFEITEEPHQIIKATRCP